MIEVASAVILETVRIVMLAKASYPILFWTYMIGYIFSAMYFTRLYSCCLCGDIYGISSVLGVFGGAFIALFWPIIFLKKIVVLCCEEINERRKKK